MNLEMQALQVSTIQRALSNRIQGKLPLTKDDHRKAVFLLEQMTGEKIAPDNGRITEKVCQRALEIADSFAYQINRQSTTTRIGMRSKSLHTTQGWGISHVSQLSTDHNDRLSVRRGRRGHERLERSEAGRPDRWRLGDHRWSPCRMPRVLAATLGITGRCCDADREHISNAYRPFFSEHDCNCLEAEWRWLDCDDCCQAGETCQLKICVECGKEVE